ncbi:hypothetical protein V9L05_09475 [Bernardetia sp. Wsw4-3y2]|uniref:hypothetical protein n=1 Tax=Bernardetia sp. Wsw4-3y2 TaxID=3127471 RepID=UPI0030D4E3E3
MKNIILLFFILAFSSCQNYYRTKEMERNEILRIFRGFKSVDFVTATHYDESSQYDFTAKSFVYNEDDYNAHQFDSLLFEIEGLENASSKLYLDDFVYFVVYDKETDEMSIWFDDTSGAVFQDGRWMESDNSHDLFSF